VTTAASPEFVSGSIVDPQAASRGRLAFLDGVRGAAAFYVLMFHSLTITAPQWTGQELSLPMRSLRLIFSQGHFAVCVFIVLSGFSLMLPLVRRDSLELSGGMRPYVVRRFRRIMPPYYAALVVSILGILAVAAADGTGAATGRRDVSLSPGSIGSHIFLVHNWSFDWAFRINGPMWSVATEWQIYFLFPLLLLPLWRRIGGLATVALIWCAALAIDFFVPDDRNLYWAAPWFVGSFALGMWGAQLSFSGRNRPPLWNRAPWGLAALVLFAAIVAMVVTGNTDWPYPVSDLIVSLFAIALIVACATGRESLNVRRRKLHGFFAARPMAMLGAFSYSVYLLQHPLIRVSEKVLGELPVSFETALWIQLLIGTPVVLAFSWMFAEFFEFPFTTGSHVLARMRAWRLLPPRQPSGTTASAVD
jgi:peptidoglycan/LPS O-acetylase OafA/YrhL